MRITNVEMDRRIQHGKLDEVGLAKRPRFDRWLCGQRRRPQLLDGFCRRDVIEMCRVSARVYAFEKLIEVRHRRNVSVRVPFFAIAQLAFTFTANPDIPLRLADFRTGSMSSCRLQKQMLITLEDNHGLIWLIEFRTHRYRPVASIQVARQAVRGLAGARPQDLLHFGLEGTEVKQGGRSQ